MMQTFFYLHNKTRHPDYLTNLFYVVEFALVWYNSLNFI